MAQNQLYTMVNKLQSGVADRDELGSLVGYAVIDSLRSFTTPSNSQEEIRFGQVKAVYQGLESALKGAHQGDVFVVLCNLAQKVDPVIRGYIPSIEGWGVEGAGSVPVKERRLFGSALTYLSRRKGSHEDILRRVGLQLIEAVRQQGPRFGNAKRTLTKDYQLLAAYFEHKDVVVANGGGRR